MIRKIIPLIFLGVGIFLSMQIVLPVVAFKVWEYTVLDQNSLLADPDPKRNLNVLGVSIENVDNFPSFVSHSSGETLLYPKFSISVPKINLKDLEVKVSSNEFEYTLAQLPGTALPGEKGNVFITGHSSLAVTSMLDSKSRKPIFANLPQIKKSDQIIVDAAGVRYVYEVQGIKVVDPKNVGVIEPPDNEGRYLTLMTCVPPGFNTKRLIVLAKLKS